MVDVADTWAGSLFGNVVDSDMTGIEVDFGMSENLVDSGGSLVDETEQGFDVEMMA